MTLKPRTCKNRACRNKFVPARPLQAACCIGCAIVLSKDKIVRDNAKAEQQVRRADKVRKEALKSRSDHMREAQQAFNAWVREFAKQAGYPCISSGKPLDWTGNGVDAGHYRSIGSAPHLRFDERNVHAQSKHDNRYLAGNAVDYRIGLIARIGLAEVEALEADQTPRKWTIEALKQIKATYRAKLKALANKGEA